MIGTLPKRQFQDYGNINNDANKYINLPSSRLNKRLAKKKAKVKNVKLK